MASANKVEVIYVPLDCLLDTRLGMIAKLDESAAAKLVSDPSYYIRDTDDFDVIDMQVFREAYANRDSSVLPYTIHTGMREFLRGIVLELNEQAATTPLLDGVRFEVNSYPYLLGDAVKEEIVRSLDVWFAGSAPATLVYIEPRVLTPKHCKDHYSAMVMYDWADWMKLHDHAFSQVRLPEVLLYAPRLYLNAKPSDEQLKAVEAELKEYMKAPPSPFEAVEINASPIVGLKLIDIAHFSSILRP